MTDYRPRISIDTSEELAERLRESIPHGLKKRIFNRMASNLVALVDKYGQDVLSIFLDGSLSLEEVMSLLSKRDEKE